MPGRFLAGAHPGFTSAVDAPHVVANLIDAGTEVFLDLTEPGEALDYEPLIRDRIERGRSLDYQQLGFPDMSVPTVEEMGQALDLLDRSLDAGRSVYVHCYGGLGRTGIVIGCHLVRRGLTGEEALQRIIELRGPRAASSSPVTFDQRRFIIEWKVGG